MERLNWDDLRIYLALMREGTLSAAARSLGLGVATISRRVERMEAALGVPLFLRHQSGYLPTDQARALMAQAEAAEGALEGMRIAARAQDEIRGMVRIASIESLVGTVITGALAPLLAENPGLSVELAYSTLTVNLHRHDADLALRMVRPESGNLKVRHLADMGFGLYGPPGGARPARHVTWTDGASMSVPRSWSLAFGAEDQGWFGINTLAGQLDAVARGIGCAVLPHFLARPAGLNLLSAALPDGTRIARPIYLVTHADLAGSRRVEAVAQALVAGIRAQRAAIEGV
ncbi:LysR family transcriptional regulator [Thioclava dalianensis]|uniref:LysR family transcriptional regulator n=1 Tax=Thioclava dalianensis TaxID=1185766 RepID=A0A074TA48_9RHOB|nr:LysR family transcriptional regulator [Thioclava dalianensis]KEP68574.1 LysR family transcriptional regulator [Thioclava dalianensis]SFN58424.1 DNA-binding transcriptional regulator, LysR family [Thioclava dalianensis]